MRERTGGVELARVVERDYVKLGGNALTVLALAKHAEISRDALHLDVMRGLGNWMQHVQREDGAFRVHKAYIAGGTVAEFRSDYYPGEAILALTRLDGIDPSGTWLDSAERGACYLISVRDAGKADNELNHDHWLLYALNELYRKRPDPVYLVHANRIAQAIANSQIRTAAPENRDWGGGYHNPPRSTPTAVRSEGLSAAYRLLRDFGDPRACDRVFEALLLGTSFQLQTQIRPELAMYLREPTMALGGFRRSLTSVNIRIDYVQHNISALLSLHSILDEHP